MECLFIAYLVLHRQGRPLLPEPNERPHDQHQVLLVAQPAGALLQDVRGVRQVPGERQKVSNAYRFSPPPAWKRGRVGLAISGEPL
ncbi:hypothetical protein TSAR_015986 [Trichomalopsis sarcophagae]|uniref:Uncharacterized protein n=1 Tax=Trichomalopsis sarcophagae TaxID=543379 RepID=A0A232FGT6_9HYME|nr:hypothetical protein TSAR_015986 [Trichomalopsis sarcophagae]